MDSHLKNSPLVGTIQRRLDDIRPLIIDNDISSKSVDSVLGITQELVKGINEK
jgi:hypothetical protein